MDILSVIRGAVGLLLILGIAFLFSANKKSVNWRLVGMGLLIQLIFAVFIIHSETLRAWFFPLGWLKDIVNWLGAAIVALLGFTLEGSKFVFGKLGASTGSGEFGYFSSFPCSTLLFF